MDISILEAIGVIATYLIGGALIIFVYGAYKRTKHENLLILAAGFFILVFGSNFATFLRVLGELSSTGSIELELAHTVSIMFQIPGLLLIFYSAIRKARV